MTVMEELDQYPWSKEECKYWTKPIMVRLIGMGAEYIDFERNIHKTDILGYGDTLEEAAEAALAELEKLHTFSNPEMK